MGNVYIVQCLSPILCRQTSLTISTRDQRNCLNKASISHMLPLVRVKT